jgi:M6 family metalloprotease-like protein
MKKLIVVLCLMFSFIGSPVWADSTCGVETSKAPKIAKYKVLYVNFADQPSLPNSYGIGLVDAIDPIVDYYETVSYGKTKIVLDPHKEWVNLPNVTSSYDLRGRVDVTSFANDVIGRVDGNIDFSKYKGVIILANPMAYELNANVAFNVNFDGKALGGFFMGSDLVGKGLYSYFIAAHEMGHSFGLKDLYGGNGASFEFIEDYTIMSHAMRGAGFLGYERLKTGWIGKKDVKCISGDTSIKLSAIDAKKGLKMGVINFGQENLFIEYRPRKNLDYNITSPGLLVYSVNNGHVQKIGVLTKNGSLSYNNVHIHYSKNVTIKIGG